MSTYTHHEKRDGMTVRNRSGKRRNRDLFQWLLRRTLGNGVLVRGSVDSTSEAVQFSGRLARPRKPSPRMFFKMVEGIPAPLYGRCEDAAMTIDDAERLTGVPADTLRRLWDAALGFVEQKRKGGRHARR